jgi:hypothetical protein
MPVKYGAVMTTRARLIMNFALFGLTFFMAVREHWSATDLVWSLWISSLVLGYAFIVAAILGMLTGGSPTPQAEAPPAPSGFRPRVLQPGASNILSMLPISLMLLFPAYAIFHFSAPFLLFLLYTAASVTLAVGGMFRDRPGWEFFPDPGRGLARAFIMLPNTVFLLAFFTVHFGGFHFGHSIFLNGMFPLLKESPFGKSVEGTFDYFVTLVRLALHAYWPFLLAGAVARIPDYLQAFTAHSDSMMFKPYVNVIKMHIMIFVFMFLGRAGASGWGVYILLVLYFFPFGEVFKDLFRKKSASPTGQV